MPREAANENELARVKVAVGILGCTGLVGQKFIELLADHPWFETAVIGASQHSAGQQYTSRFWKLAGPVPSSVAGKQIVECKPENFKECKAVFSALDASVAGIIEQDFISRGFAVFSNAKNFRMERDVPLVVPTANPHELVNFAQLRNTSGGGGGFIVCNSNCTTSGIAVVLSALEDTDDLQVDSIVLTTMQAISGAGISPGVSAVDLTDNLIPHIEGEEEKLECELAKILSRNGNNPIWVSASCNRVPVLDGHTACLAIKFKNSAEMDKYAMVARVKTRLQQYNPDPANQNGTKLPSWPQPVVQLFEAEDRPQPRLDRSLNGGMTVSVGRIRPCTVLDVKMVVLIHNTVFGAAGSSILNAELASSLALIG